MTAHLRSRFALVGLLVLLPVSAAAQGAGSSASTVLRVPPGPRPLALGGALVAVPDAFGAEYNPASLPGETTLAVAYQALPVGASAGAAALALPLGPVRLAFSARFLDYGEIEVIEERPDLPIGDPTGETASGGELTTLLAAALRAGPLHVGIAGRWLRLDVADLSDDAFSGDAGVILEAVEDVRLGVSVQNLGGEVRAGRAAPLPRTWRAGASVRRGIRGVRALATLESRHREDRTGLGAGLELAVGGQDLGGVARIGYETRPEPGDAFAPFVFGAGVRVDRITVDFAYRALGPLGSTRQVGLGYTF